MQLTLTPDSLHLRLGPWERLAAMPPWHALDIPLRSIRQVRSGRPDSHHLHGRAAGTSVPGYFYAGAFHRNRCPEFWYAHPHRPCLQLELEQQPYDRLVLEVKAPEAWAERLRQAGKPVEP